MISEKDWLASEMRKEVVAIFERVLEAHKAGKISREKAAGTSVNVIDALRKKNGVDAERWYGDLHYLLAVLDQ